MKKDILDNLIFFYFQDNHAWKKKKINNQSTV